MRAVLGLVGLHGRVGQLAAQVVVSRFDGRQFVDHRETCRSCDLRLGELCADVERACRPSPAIPPTPAAGRPPRRLLRAVVVILAKSALTATDTDAAYGRNGRELGGQRLPDVPPPSPGLDLPFQHRGADEIAQPGEQPDRHPHDRRYASSRAARPTGRPSRPRSRPRRRRRTRASRSARSASPAR